MKENNLKEMKDLKDEYNNMKEEIKYLKNKITNRKEKNLKEIKEKNIKKEIIELNSFIPYLKEDKKNQMKKK